MRDLWSRIERWLDEHAPDKLGSLAPGAEESQLAKAEAALGVRLPDDFRASALIHDGERDWAFVVHGWNLMSLERIVEEWRVWKDLYDAGEYNVLVGATRAEGPIWPDWWRPSWIPIAGDGGGNFFCLDLDPAPGGTVGQVVEVWHDGDARTVVAPSFRAWLADFADALEAGRWRLVDGLLEEVGAT